MKAVVLLSGGIDSTVALADALDHGWQTTCLSFDYGQRHQRELDSAQYVARAMGVPQQTVNVRLWGGQSSLVGDMRDVDQDGAGDPARPNAVVPGRNTVFLSLGLAYAQAVGAERIVIGANADDAEGFPDCRPAYLEAFGKVARLAAPELAMKVHAPNLRYSKEEILYAGEDFKVDWLLTWSCYDPQPAACGRCDACRLRLAAFDQADLHDPIVYA